MHWELSQQCSWSCRIRFAACFSFSGPTSVTSFFFNCFSYFRVNWFRCCWIKDQTRLGDDLSQKHFMALEGESVFCFHLPDWWLTVDIVSSSLVDDSGSRKKEKRNRYLFFFCSMSVWRAKKMVSLNNCFQALHAAVFCQNSCWFTLSLKNYTNYYSFVLASKALRQHVKACHGCSSLIITPLAIFYPQLDDTCI